MNYETLIVTLKDGIAQVQINRPDKANAMSLAVWHEIRTAFNWIDATPEARVAVISGSGAHFSSGIDLQMLINLGAEIQDDCDGRMREKLRRTILDLQDTLSSIERCRKPVLAAVHGACIGGGVDLICACDMRYCSADAYFLIKEIDIGMTADVGTLQRLGKVIPEGVARELAYTGRRMPAQRAYEVGLVQQVYDDHTSLVAGVLETAGEIAGKSPLAIWGTKVAMNYARDHGVDDSLEQIATWQAGMFQPEDMMEAFSARADKRDPVYPELLPEPRGL